VPCQLEHFNPAYQVPASQSWKDAFDAGLWFKVPDISILLLACQSLPTVFGCCELHSAPLC
jgi:hypothetical protein